LTEEQSPAAEPVEAKKYDIDIYRAWCKECGLCAAFCPKGCIKLNEAGAPVIEKVDCCTGCGWCELHCPDFAISVHERQKTTPKEEAD
jgi:2-oxoglutarate ferredoxin oxidoreductase subunit delta